MKIYYIYILSNKPRGTLYIGVTNNLSRRYFEHIEGRTKSFTARYDVRNLVYFEQTENVETAIAREKQLKNWRREWKINLIESANPLWKNLNMFYRMDSEINSE